MNEKKLPILSEKTMQTIYLQLFTDIAAHQSLESESNNEANPITKAYQTLRTLAGSNKTYYDYFNQHQMVMPLISNLVHAYGIQFDKGFEQFIFHGFDDNLIYLKRFLTILVNYDVRKTFFYNAAFLNKQLNAIISLNKLTDFTNPVLNFFQASCSLRIEPITENTKNLLERASQVGCINAGLLLNAIQLFFRDNQEVRYCDKKFINSLDVEDTKLNTHKFFAETLARFNITVPPFSDCPYLNTSFSRVYRLSSSWLIGLALDFNGTNKILDIIQRKIIPVNEKKLFTLIHSSKPEYFLRVILKEQTDFLQTKSLRFLILLSSDLAPELYRICLTKSGSLTPTHDVEKTHKYSYQPEQILTLYRKIPKFKLSVIGAIAGSGYYVTSILAHRSVNVKKWKIKDLYNFLIKKTTAYTGETLMNLAKLPFMLTYFKSANEIINFMNSEVMNSMLNGCSGNLVFEKLGGNIYQAHKLQITSELNKNNISLPSNLLTFLSNLPAALVIYLCNRFPNDLIQMKRFICEDAAFNKLITTNNKAALIRWIPNIDVLLKLHELKFDKTSVLDFLTDTTQIENLSSAFPFALSLINAYRCNILALVKSNLNLLLFTAERLKEFHSYIIDQNLSVLTILTDADPKILKWIQYLKTDTIIELAKRGVLQLLTEWCFIPEGLQPANDQLFQCFIILNELKFDGKISIFKFFLSYEMQHAFFPLIEYLRQPSDRSRLFDIDFLKAISRSDRLHPIIIQYKLEDWYRLFLCKDSHIEKTNLFTYLTHPCNTIYWQDVVDIFGELDKICEKPTEVINFIESHPSKKSYYEEQASEQIVVGIEDKPKMLNDKLADYENKKRKQQIIESPQNNEKRQKIEPNQAGSRSNNHRYSKFVTQFGFLSSNLDSLSPQQQITNLRKIKQDLASHISSLTPKPPIKDNDVQDFQHNANFDLFFT